MKYLLIATALLSPLSVQSQDEPAVTDSLTSIVISATRAGSRTPVTRSEVIFSKMPLPAGAASLPQTLSLLPSVISTTEGGNPLGYSNIRVRGITGYATNVTLNGITLNDAESQEVFWVNIPSLSSIVSSAQVQRGLGTSSSGPGAFGASINLASGIPADHTRAELSAGSFHTTELMFSAGHIYNRKRGGNRNSAAEPDDGENAAVTDNARPAAVPDNPGSPFFQITGTKASSKGYIRQAPTDVNSLYATAGWKNARTLIKGTFLRGEQHTGITWEGIPLDIFPSDPRYNASPGASDNFTQSHCQLSASHDFGSIIWTGTLNLTHGNGYYEYPGSTEDDGTRDFTESTLSVLRTELIWGRANIHGSSGIYISGYDGSQWETSTATSSGASLPHYYDNKASKREQNVWSRAEWEKGRIDLYADIHLRAVQHVISGTDWNGTIPEVDEDWLLISPRAGAGLTLSGGNRIYGSIALGHREPARSDILAAPSRPEHLIDLEAGWELLSERFSLAATLYAMEYRDMLLETGELSIAGYAIKANVPRAYRRGLELAASFKPIDALTLGGNLTLSSNRRQDLSGGWDRIVLSPATIAALSIQADPLTSVCRSELLKRVRLRTETKYVGDQYWSADGLIPAYCVTDLSVGTRWKMVSLTAFMVNAFNLQYYASAYSGGVYPQSPKAFKLRVTVDL